MIDVSHLGGVPLGATPLPEGGVGFLVWAPHAERVEVVAEGDSVPMEAAGHGYHRLDVAKAGPGTRYRYRLDGELERPDPASRLQPEGVHGPSEVVTLDFAWTDQAWSGLPLEEYVIYELHVGTYTAEGTFQVMAAHLDDLAALGVTALELMPVAQFPGERNWGYDGAYPFAVQHSYGGPQGLAALVDACHRRGLAVILDVVYNHLGPEGNYLGDFGPYFTDRYRTAWGTAVNFDGPGSDQVRRFFVENALQWVRDFHVDGLRLDAVHAIFDHSARPFLEELAEAVHRQGEESGRTCLVIAEDNRNDPRLVRPPGRGGLGLDAVWTDDFHHAVHVTLTGEQNGYYQDYRPRQDLAEACRAGFVYQGRHSPFLGHRRGAPASDLTGRRHVVFAQNHDQVGNRLLGERLATLVPWEGLQLAAALVLLSPYVPLLFMGEEYGETAPFLYFVDHEGPGLLEAVREGRREEFSGFEWAEEPPDPGDPATFERSRPDHQLRKKEPHASLRSFYRELLSTRREVAALRGLDKDRQEVELADPVLRVRRWTEGSEALALFNLGSAPARTEAGEHRGPWRRRLATRQDLPPELEPGMEVTLPGYGVALYVREEDD